MKRELRKVGTESYESHRNDFETCPECGYKIDSELWMKAAHILCLEPRFYVAGKVSVITACSKCKAESWVHNPLIDSKYANLHDWPAEWMVAMKKRADYLKLQALRDWAKGLCGKCKKLNSGKSEFCAWRYCKKGSGPVVTECESFAGLIGK